MLRFEGRGGVLGGGDFFFLVLECRCVRLEERDGGRGELEEERVGRGERDRWKPFKVVGGREGGMSVTALAANSKVQLAHSQVSC